MTQGASAHEGLGAVAEPHAAQQPLQVRGNSSLCAAPLLRDPLTQARIRRFHSFLGLGACMLPGVHHALHGAAGRG